MNAFLKTRGLVAIVMVVAAALTGEALAASPETNPRSRIILTMPGKGSSVAYDFGVISRLADAVPGLKNEGVILTGSSSGSAVAGFFGLRGINAESLRQSQQMYDLFDRDAIRKNEDPNQKLGKLVNNEPTEMDHETLRRSLALVLGVDMKSGDLSIADIATRSRMTFQLPVMIVAANHEVLWDRQATSTFKNRGEKVVDYDTFAVAWRPEVHSYYQKNPARFAKDHRDLVLGKTPALGKACTYFVTEDLFAALSCIPAEERLGDVRIMKTPQDLVLAILASVSEPTYFTPVLETDYSKLMVGDHLGDRGQSKRRLYAGGFIMPAVAHDARRAYPDSIVLSTGSLGYPAQARQLLQTWYAVDHKILHRQNDYWVDFSATPNEHITRKLAFRDLSVVDEFRLGQSVADDYLQHGNAAPKKVIQPRLRYAIGDESGVTPNLATMRGLATLGSQAN